MRVILLLIPFFLFAEIIKYENLKPYYYENQIINIKAKIVLPKPKEIIAIPSNVEVNLSKKNPYIYYINIKFKADNIEHKLILVSQKFYKEFDLNSIIKIKKINPPKNYSNILANKLEIINPISSKYKNNNILVSFTLKCDNCNIKDFNLSAKEQNLTLISNNEASYYMIVPKNKKKIEFYYFNLKQEKFNKIEIPIILKQETISTQTDLNPEENRFFTPLNILILGIIAFFLIVFIIYQKIWILFFPLILGGYLIYVILPKGEVILKRNTKVQILPTKQSTVIYITKEPQKAKILNKTDNYTKVEINKKIGWVKNEDIE
ncbi:hypothetical protein JCM11957_06560 [Caminibacter profundus]